MTFPIRIPRKFQLWLLLIKRLFLYLSIKENKYLSLKFMHYIFGVESQQNSYRVLQSIFFGS